MEVTSGQGECTWAQPGIGCLTLCKKVMVDTLKGRRSTLLQLEVALLRRPFRWVFFEGTPGLVVQKEKQGGVPRKKYIKHKPNLRSDKTVQTLGQSNQVSFLHILRGPVFQQSQRQQMATRAPCAGTATAWVFLKFWDPLQMVVSLAVPFNTVQQRTYSRKTHTHT